MDPIFQKIILTLLMAFATQISAYVLNQLPPIKQSSTKISLLIKLTIESV